MPEDIRSDEALMESLVLGQGEVFDELVRRYQNRFLATAYRMTGNHEAAEDITQETFTAIWSRRAGFNKNIAGFSTWQTVSQCSCLIYQAQHIVPNELGNYNILYAYFVKCNCDTVCTQGIHHAPSG